MFHLATIYVSEAYYLCNIFCLGREAFSNSLPNPRVTEKNIKVDSLEVTESYVSEVTSIGLDSKPSSDNIESLKQKENNGSCTLRRSDYIKEPCDMDVDESSIVSSQNKEKCNYIANTIQGGEDQVKNNPSVHYKSNGSTIAVKVWSVWNLFTHLIIESLLSFLEHVLMCISD